MLWYNEYLINGGIMSKQKYTVTFPPEAGQYQGTHFFFTKKERSAFLRRAAERGASLANISLN